MDYLKEIETILKRTSPHILSALSSQTDDFFGKQPSKKIGQGVEFNHYSQYTEGENVKNIDWKVFGRLEKLFIKKFERDSNERFLFLFDTSKSMLFKGNNSVYSKLEYSFISAGVLTYYLLQSQHPTAYQFSNYFTGYQGERKDFSFFIEQFEKQNIHSALNWSFQENIHKKGRKTVLIFSDFFDDIDFLVSKIKKLSEQHSFHFFHVLDSSEIDLAEKDLTKYIDLESGEEIITDPSEIYKIYKEEIETHIKQLKTSILSSGFHYHQFLTNHKIEENLTSLLK
ncbi:DUF58 domain-containing protein [bacterium]|nr:DUF58 domain-containing protein [bacterium]